MRKPVGEPLHTYNLKFTADPHPDLKANEVEVKELKLTSNLYTLVVTVLWDGSYRESWTETHVILVPKAMYKKLLTQVGDLPHIHWAPKNDEADPDDVDYVPVVTLES